MRRKIVKIALVAGVITAVISLAVLLAIAAVVPATREWVGAAAGGQTSGLAGSGKAVPVAPRTANPAEPQAANLAEPQAASQAAPAYDRQNLLRLHVVANSDSARDQALKMRIRDLVGQKMAAEFAGVRDIREARRVAAAHLDEIRALAENEVRAWGESYAVQVRLGSFDFPLKTYGQLTLPAGEYQAVRVIIGRGRGANWWCVLFPPLCFVDVSRAADQAVPGGPALAVAAGKAEAGSAVRAAGLAEAGPAGGSAGGGAGSGSGESAHQTVKVRFKLLEVLNRFFH